ncbi:hypothetical protein [Pseudomonas sp. bs2935]|uniref:hypothetical protein n=1 Tax=Pseudomonas sp. bs2935 TaxID=1761895 RepID=UPI000879C469|nr:hypothetical protein [Pseudomonas sp. bs2935]SDS33293.1 hypothetical protein SAMN04490210_2207 [Pseudomonas sp. bs2935]
MSEVNRYYIGVFGGEAQARVCLAGLKGMIRDGEGKHFTLAEDFDRVTAERDAALEEVILLKKGGQLLVSDRNELQQRLTAADELADLLLGLLREARQHHGVMLMSDPPQDAWKHHRMNERIDAALNANSR